MPPHTEQIYTPKNVRPFGRRTRIYPLSFAVAGAGSAFIVAGECGEIAENADLFGAAGLLLFALCAVLDFLGKCGGWGLRVLCAVAFFCAGVWYFDFRCGGDAAFPTGEVHATVAVEILDVSGSHKARGVARVIGVPAFYRQLEPLVGRDIWFSAESADFLKVSQKALFNGTIKPLSPSEGGFEAYLKSRGISRKMSVPAGGVEIVASQNCFWAFFERARGYMDSTLSETVPEKFGRSRAARTLRAMILGDKTLLTHSQKRDFADTGTMHVFAVSGLHVGFAAGLVYFALSLLGAGRRLKPVVALPLLFVYVGACGMHASSVRAWTMVAVFWVALAFGRGVKPMGALFLSAAVWLALFPRAVFEAGFLLSYFAVAALLVYGLGLFAYLKRFRPYKYIPDTELSAARRFWRFLFDFLSGGFAMSLAAGFAGMMFTSHFFGYVAPLAILYSPFFVAGAGIAVSLGVTGLFLPFIAPYLNTVASGVVWCMDFSASFAARNLPLVWNVRFESLPAAVFFTTVSLLVCAFARKWWIRFVLAPLACAVPVAVSYLWR